MSGTHAPERRVGVTAPDRIYTLMALLEIESVLLVALFLVGAIGKPQVLVEQRRLAKALPAEDRQNLLHAPRGDRLGWFCGSLDINSDCVAPANAEHLAATIPPGGTQKLEPKSGHTIHGGPGPFQSLQVRIFRHVSHSRPLARNSAW